MSITYPIDVSQAPPVSDPGDKVALCGDWHGNIDRALRALNVMADQGVTTVIHVGDFLFGYDGDFTPATIEVATLAADLGITLMFIDGNHDDHEFLQSGLTRPGFAQLADNLWHIRRGTVWNWRGKRWVGLGGAGSIDKFQRTPGFDFWDDEVVTHGQVLAALATLGEDQPDVIVTHERPKTAPKPIPDRSFGPVIDRHIDGTPELLQYLGNPKVWVYGHYHARSTAHSKYTHTRFESLASDLSALEENVICLDSTTLETIEI